MQPDSSFPTSRCRARRATYILAILTFVDVGGCTTNETSVLPMVGSGGQSGFGGADSQGGTGALDTFVTKLHPFGDEPFANAPPAFSHCQTVGVGPSTNLAAGMNTVVVSAGGLIAVDPTNLSILAKYSDAVGDHALLRVSANGATVVSVTKQNPKVARVWDANTRTLVGTLEGHARDITALAIDTAGATVATGSGDGSIKLWNAAGGAATRTLAGLGGSVAELAVAENRVAAISSDDFRLWGPTSTQPLASASAPRGKVAFSPAGDALFLSYGGGINIDIYDTSSGMVAVHERVSSTLTNNQAVLFDLETLVPTGPRSVALLLRNLDDWVMDSVTFPLPFFREPAARKIAVPLKHFSYQSQGSIGLDSAGSLYAVNSVGAASLPTSLPSFPGERLAISPDGTKVAQGTAKGPIRVFGSADLLLAGTVTGNTDVTTSVIFSHDGKKMYGGSIDGSIRVWNTADNSEIKFRQVGPVVTAAVSPDDTRLAVGIRGASTSGKVLILDTESLETLAIFDLDSTESLAPAQANMVVFSSDGKSLAVAGSFNASVQMWSVQDRSRVWINEDKNAQKAVLDLRFMANDEFVLASVMGVKRSGLELVPTSNHFAVYEGATGKSIVGYRVELGLLNESQQNRFVVTKGLLVSGYENGAMGIWHLASGKFWFTITDAHQKAVRDMAVLKDGSVVTTSPDGVLSRWCFGL